MSSFYNINGINSGAVIGTIIAFIGGTVPTGWLLCDGAAIPSQYTVLKQLLGDNLPNLTDNRMMYGKNLKSDSCINDGLNSLTLLIDNLPAHSHSVTINDASHNHVITEVGQTIDGSNDDHGYAINNTGTQGGADANVTNEAAIATGATDDAHTHTISFNDMRAVSGTAIPSNNSINIINPYYTVKWIIKGI